MTTHLTQDDPVEEEPELVLIDDEEYEAAHRYDETGDEYGDDDEDEFEFSFEDELDEAIALDLSDQMDPSVEDADDRMAGLFSSQREASSTGDGTATDARAAGVAVPRLGDGDAGAVDADATLFGAGAAAPVLSKQEAKAEEKRQRENLKRRKEMDKAAREDDKERQREEKAQAAAAEREAAAAAVAAKKEAADAAKRDAAEAKRQAAEAKTQQAEDAKRAAAEEKIRQAEEKAEAKRAAEAEKIRQADEKAEAKRQAAEAKTQQAQDAKRAAAEEKIRQAEEKAEAKRAAAAEKTRQADQKAEAKRIKAEAKRTRSEEKRQGAPIPAALSGFVEGEPVAARTRKDARVEKREGTKRSLLVVVMVVLLVVVGVAAYVLTRDKAGVGTGARTGSGAVAGAGAGAAAGAGAGAGTGTGTSALPAAVASTVSASTADVAYALAISGSQPASINGGGSVDLATQGSNLSLTYSQGGRSFPEQIVYDGGQGFYDLGAIVNYVTPGYGWVSMDLAPGGSPVPGIGVGGVLADPSALVSVLQASASSARDVGSVQVDGAPATEYSISLSQTALSRVLAAADLPSFVRSAPYTQLNEQAYVDDSGRVSRIVAVGTYPASGQSVTAATTLDLSHYGTPVSIAPPPASQVVSEEQFEASAARLGGTPTP